MKVSVIVTTYNHEKYIIQCLESVLSQIGDFSMEIIVGDDCSTDNTRTIVQGYLEKYPEMITLLPPEHNLGITKNLKRCLDACSGEYIAICEGDDYWTDKNKLQKQKDFLEIYKDCSMCFSALMLYFEDTNTFVPHGDQESLEKEFITADDLIERNYIGNFSCCMYRKSVIRSLPEGIFDLYTVDWFFNISCGQFGRIGFIRDRMSVYRLHTKGTWTGKGQLEKMEELKQNIDIYNEFQNYEHNLSFSKLKKGVDEEIIRLKTIEGTEIINNPMTAKKNNDSLRKIKNKFMSLIRKTK